MTKSKDMSPGEVFSLQNPSLGVYIACSCILALKMIGIVALTVYKRKVHKVFLSPEDAEFNKGQLQQHDAVERVRRAHMNDLENIPLFWIVGLVYLFTKPPLGLSCFLYFTYTITRVAHTIVYAVYPVRQPARSILFLIGLILILYMALHAMVIGFVHI